MTHTIDTLLLLALPASGKSELRRYLGSLDTDVARRDLHLGPLVQLDDYPYVYMLRRISDAMTALGERPLFFTRPGAAFTEPREWGTLTHLLNEDYAALGTRLERPESAAGWLFDRYDRARQQVGVTPAFDSIDAGVRERLAESVEGDAASLWTDLAAAVASWQPGSTVVIEFARGGPDGSKMPLPAPNGYLYSLAQLSDDIKRSMSVLYVWVTPEQSRKKNAERARPGREGDASILFHGVPEEVMYQEYGTDDFIWLLAEGGGRSIDVGEIATPVAVLDNREDHTSFLRADSRDWPADEVARLHESLKKAFNRLGA